MRGWLISGTGTGVGKTVVAAALAALRAAAGADVVYVKPIQSGAADGDDDAADVGALSGVPAWTGATLGPPLAPGVALRLAGETWTRDDLLATIDDAATGRDEVVLEGAGGLLVELGSDGTTAADLAVALGLPVLVVVRPGLGTLNETLLTIESIDRRGLGLAGIVIGRYPRDTDDLATRSNVAELDRFAGGRLVGVVPDLPALDVTDAAEWFAPSLGGRFDRDAWLGRCEVSVDELRHP